METQNNERVEGPLDYPITDEQFEAAINKLKANKSLGFDNILNAVIKIGKNAIKGHLVNLVIESQILANTLLFGVLASLYLLTKDFAKRMIDPKLKITEVSRPLTEICLLDLYLYRSILCTIKVTKIKLTLAQNSPKKKSNILEALSSSNNRSF